MKLKFLVLGFVALLFAGVASAQEAGSWRIGVQAGMNLSNVGGKDVSGLDSKIGFNLGLKSDYNFNENAYLSLGLLYDVKGFKYKDTNNDISQNNGYIEVPVHIGFRFKLDYTTSIFGEFGPYFSYLASEGENFDVIEDFQKFDAGLGVRVGTEFSKFQIFLGYDFGLTKVVKDVKAYNRNFQVGVAYMF
jgi:hypothetical protein